MRGQTQATRGWEFDNIARLSAYYPNRYRIPEQQRRRRLLPTERVKLSLLFLAGDDPANGVVESARVLVEVLSGGPGSYRGRLLANAPLGTALRRGDQITFDADHVVDLWLDQSQEETSPDAWMEQHAENVVLHRSLRRIAFCATPPSPQELSEIYPLLLDARYLIPLASYLDGSEIAFSRTTDGDPFLPAYLDRQTLTTSYGATEQAVFSGRELIALAVRERAPAIAINPIGQDDHLHWIPLETIHDIYADIQRRV